MQQLPLATLTSNENPLKKLELIHKPLTIKQDQESKQVINTIRETPPEMYTPLHLLVAPQDKLSLFRKHIPKQKEIDALLKELRKRVLHNLMVNLETKDLIEHYSKSLRYRDIYNYITDGRLQGNLNTQKKIAGKATNYVIVNGLLFKKTQHKEYYHIGLTCESRAKSAFMVLMGKWEFKRTPFGLSQTPAYFQLLTDKVLMGCSSFAMGYLDDIILFSKSEEEHLQHLEEIFTRLCKFGLKMKREKCSFFKKHIQYLGHLVSHQTFVHTR